jgi:hypothetical protein
MRRQNLSHFSAAQQREMDILSRQRSRKNTLPVDRVNLEGSDHAGIAPR